MLPPGKVLTSEREERVENNEQMKVEGERRGSRGERCFGYFCHLGMGFCASTAETGPVEHLFHTTRVQATTLPRKAASLILALIEKEKGRLFLFFSTPPCGRDKWVMRAEQKRKKWSPETQRPR